MYEAYEEALVVYDQAIQLDPTDSNAYTSKAEALGWGLNRFHEAIACCELVPQSDPAFLGLMFSKVISSVVILGVQQFAKRLNLWTRFSSAVFHTLSGSRRTRTAVKRLWQSMSKFS